MRKVTLNWEVQHPTNKYIEQYKNNIKDTTQNFLTKKTIRFNPTNEEKPHTGRTLKMFRI